MKHQCKLINVLNIGIAFIWFLATLLVGVGLSSNPADAQPFAYVTNPLSGTVSVIDTNPASTDFNKVVSTIEVKVSELYDYYNIAITPHGTRAYMVNQRSRTVSVIDIDPSSADFNKVVSTIEVGGVPAVIAFTPDGTRAYLTHHGWSDNVWVIDTDPSSTEFNKVVAKISVVLPFPLTLSFPHGIAFTPDGTRAYISNIFTPWMSVIDTDPSSTNFNKVVDQWRMNAAYEVAITPDGTRAYAPYKNVSVIDIDPSSTDFNKVVSTIEAGPHAQRIAITPDGTRAYVTNYTPGTVSVIDTNPGSADFNKVVSTIEVGGYLDVIASTPDGSHIYVQVDRRSIVVIDTSNNKVVDTIIMEYGAYWVAIAPSVDTDKDFAAFEIKRARVNLHKNTGGDRFKVVGSFALEAMIDEIDFLNKDVTVTLGGYSETIAGGYFVREDGKYQYKGGSGSITEIKIRDDGRFSVKGKGLDLSSISLDSRVNSVNFDLQFGGYRGETEIQLDKRGRFQKKDRTRNKKGRRYRKGKR